MRAEAGEPDRPDAAPRARAPWTVLLAGGEDRRLSRFVHLLHTDDRPKQFASIIGTRSMLRHTFDRALRHSPPARILVMVTDGQQHWARAQLPSHSAGKLLVQPFNLDTGPALSVAIAYILSKDPHARILVLPCDHFVFPEGALEDVTAAVLSALAAMQEPKAVLLGAEPSGPRAGMGWILPEPAAGPARRPPLLRVRKFIEKPPPELAGALFAERALWNTFILAGKAQHLWRLLRARAPEPTARVGRCCRHSPREGWRRRIEKIFELIEPFNFSSRVLQGAPEELLVAPLEGIMWNDWGTPEGIQETLESLGWHDRLKAAVYSSEAPLPA